MPPKKYRLNTVTIEGFGGFTEPQQVKISQKHTFVFGPNGHGKSSILEAIRWCLFGQAQRPEAEVRNIYYPLRECAVTLELASPAGSLTLRRKLRPGAARSDLTITDVSGAEVKQADVFPHLARLGPKEGTHIIVAGQQAAARRPQADISDFGRVLYSYLDVEDVPDLIKLLDELIQEKTIERERLAGSLEALIAEARNKLSQVELQLAELMRTSPWDSKTPPVFTETSRKIDAFQAEIARLAGDTPQHGLTLEQKLDAAERAARTLMTAERADLEIRLREQRARLSALQNANAALNTAREQYKASDALLNQHQSALAAILEGNTVEQWTADLTTLQSQMSYQQLKADILKRAKELYEREPFDQCPVCDTAKAADELLASITAAHAADSKQGDDLAQKCDALREKLRKASELDAAIRQCSETLARHKAAEDQALGTLMKLMESADLPTDQQINLQIAALVESTATLHNQITGAGQAFAEREKAIKALRAEFRFQHYQAEATRLRRILAERITGPQGIYDEYHFLLRTTAELKQIIEAEFDKAVAAAIPPLNDMMTEVYKRLTQQVSFDKVLIDRSGGALALFVGSTRRPGRHNPDDVLNGQANSALRLVPYFVFSEFQQEALELELLLIDDPSQSFDTSHVGILLEELQKISSRTQLIIASHEREKFEPVLDRHFSKQDMQILGVETFDPVKGPTIAYSN
jgi:DNA repair exonuclease SbcCD ATPase subunit